MKLYGVSYWDYHMPKAKYAEISQNDADKIFDVARNFFYNIKKYCAKWLLLDDTFLIRSVLLNWKKEMR